MLLLDVLSISRANGSRRGTAQRGWSVVGVGRRGSRALVVVGVVGVGLWRRFLELCRSVIVRGHSNNSNLGE